MSDDMPFGFGARQRRRRRTEPTRSRRRCRCSPSCRSCCRWSGGPVNWDLARQLAVSEPGRRRSRSSARPSAPPSPRRSGWPTSGSTRSPTCPPACDRSRPGRGSSGSSRPLPVWSALCDPVAARVVGGDVQRACPTGAGCEALGGRRTRSPAIMGQIGGLMFGAQVGQALGGWPARCVASTDVGLPLGPTGVAALRAARTSPRSAPGSSGPADEVRLYLALREAAHQRLFAPRAVAAPAAARRRRRLRARHHRRPVGASSDAMRRRRPDEPGEHAGGAGRRAVRAARRRPSSRPRCAGWRRCWRWSRAGSTRSSPRPPASGCPAPTRCARRRAAAGRPAARPSRRSPRWSGWSCGRAGCATPPRCGGASPSSTASAAATRSGRTPTCCRPPTTSTTRWASPTTIGADGSFTRRRRGST